MPVDDPAAALRWAAGLSLVTAVTALVAAGAEIWRFVLLLQGRTLVLSGAVVRASDVLVAASGLAVVTSGVLMAAFAVPALVRTHHAAARRLGYAPARSGPGIVARLLVPIWSIYGAGQIVIEIDRMLAQRPHAGSNPARDTESAGQPGPARGSWVVKAWWLSWIVSALLITVTLARGLGGSLQAIADTVELHIAVDLVAALVAALAAVILLRFARAFTDRTTEYDNWVVQPPGPTRLPDGSSPSTVVPGELRSAGGRAPVGYRDRVSKKTQRRTTGSTTALHADQPAGDNPRRPCPCGSGKRYKACHGSADRDMIVTRPFADLAAEPELIALREFLPLATAP